MIERMKASKFPKKYSVQFVTTEGKVSAPFYFFQHFDHEASTTWQVLRSDFDCMLLENAREKGAEVMEETEAMGFLRENGQVCGVRATSIDGTRLDVRSRVTIDASGRRALAISRNDWRKWDPELNKVAVWTYFRGAKRDPGLDAGSTTIAYLPEKSWFWYIPLPDDTVSVGIVAERDYLFGDSNDLGEIFCGEIGKNAWIKDHLAPGRQFGKYYATKEFSYRSEYCAQDGLVLVGDAFAFLDPVFSSGVYLALRSGELAGDAIDRALEQNDVSACQFRDYSDRLRREIEAMRKLVYAFYDQTFSFGRLIKGNPDIRGDLTDCLIGNLDKDFTELFAAVGKLASVPEPVPHGGPLARAEQQLSDS
jgi:flavin-dependent dehydrogenase